MNVDFGELVCYIQTIILFLLLIGYAINYRKQHDGDEKVKKEVSCPSCGFTMAGQEVNFCSKCGNSLSHSKGLSLEK